MNPLRYFIPILTAALVAFGGVEAHAQATLLPPGETCFTALTPTSGGPNGTGTGFVGLLGTITAGSGGTTGTYSAAFTGGHGTGATGIFTVSGGGVTAVSVLNPGQGFAVGDTLSASSANIGNVSGFSVPVSSVAINQSLAGGSVYYYIPNTGTFKQTWQNSGQTVLNTNPVTLDANGCAIVYGAGIYRQVLEDSQNNIVWDQLTASTGTPGAFYWANLAGGTANVITVTDASFAGTDGQIISFIPLFTNTGAATLNVSSYGAVPIVKDTGTGAVALTGGEIVANSPSNIVEVEFSATQQNFHILNLVQASASAAPVQPPQGYLNDVGVANGGPIQGGTDISAATTIYYTPYVGNQIPIWNGSSFTILTFSELDLVLSSSAQSASTIYDVCVFNNGGVPTIVFGPAWSDSAAGAGARGTGAGSAQISYQSGILVNTGQIAANNGSNSYTVPALECTYVGSIFIDGTAGEVSTNRVFGQNRKWGIWNAYNRVPIGLQVGDSTASWEYDTATIRASNAAPASYSGATFNAGSGTTANGLTVFTGLAEEEANCSFSQKTSNNANAGNVMSNGIGLNSTTAFSGVVGQNLVPGTTKTVYQPVAHYIVAPSLGTNVIAALEEGPTGTTNLFYGTQSNMLLQCSYRG